MQLRLVKVGNTIGQVKLRRVAVTSLTIETMQLGWNFSVSRKKTGTSHKLFFLKKVGVYL